MPDIANLVHEISTSTGTGDFTLASVNGKQTFNDAFSTGGSDKFYYFISNRDAAEWEYGTGHMSDATTLVRDTVVESSNSNSLVSFSSGEKDLTNDLPAEKQVSSDDLAVVATSGDYGDLGNQPTLGTAAAQDTSYFATAAQGEKADSALQFADRPIFATISALAAATAPSVTATAYVQGYAAAGDSGAGTFIWNGANLSSQVTSDPRKGVYVAPPSDATGASGAWVRKYSGPAFVDWWGAVGDNSTNDQAAIQAAEDFLSSLSYPAELHFTGTYAISSTVLKKAKVHWRGPGKIRRKDNAAPLGTQWALIYANAVHDWSIEGVGVEAIPHDVVIATSLPRKGGGPGPGNWNSCIDAYKCERWRIRDCELHKFSQGIKYTGCGNFDIEDNYLYGDTAYTIQDMFDGTAQTFDAGGTGGIVYLYDNAFVTRMLGPSRIVGNHVYAPGLDSGIELGINVFERKQNICSNNIIQGTHCGIISYCGSVSESYAASPASTYNKAQIISDNYIYATWEQGIYFRGGLGVQITGNYIERAALNTSDPNSSSGAIILRVNPWKEDSNTADIYVSAANGHVSRDHGGIVANNRCVDIGRDDGASVGGIYCCLDNFNIVNNDIVRSTEKFSTNRMPAILIGNGHHIRNFNVSGNRIAGRWATGVTVGEALRTIVLGKHYGRIVDNVIELVSGTTGIDLNWYGPDIVIDRNSIASVTTAIQLRYTPYSRISANRIRNATNGIIISNGCLASDFPYLLSKGTITGNIRRGGTTRCYNNEFWNCTTPHSVTVTGTGDASFHGRCAEWSGDRIDGAPFIPNDFASGTPPSTFTARTWQKRDVVFDSSGSSDKKCTAPGTYGVTTTTTGNTTNGSPIITNVALLDGYGPGIWLNPSAGFAARVMIVAIDVVNSTITVNANASSNQTGVTLSLATPTFA